MNYEYYLLGFLFLITVYFLNSFLKRTNLNLLKQECNDLNKKKDALKQKLGLVLATNQDHLYLREIKNIVVCKTYYTSLQKEIALLSDKVVSKKCRYCDDTGYLIRSKDHFVINGHKNELEEKDFCICPLGRNAHNAQQYEINQMIQSWNQQILDTEYSLSHLIATPEFNQLYNQILKKREYLFEEQRRLWDLWYRNPKDHSSYEEYVEAEFPQKLHILEDNQNIIRKQNTFTEVFPVNIKDFIQHMYNVINNPSQAFIWKKRAFSSFHQELQRLLNASKGQKD